MRVSADDELRAQLDDLLGADTDTESVLAAFEQAPSLLAVCEGPDLVITALNDAARQVYGDRVGLPVAQALAGPDVDEILAWTDETFRTGRPLTDRLWHGVPSAEGVGEGTWLSFSMVPCLAADGSVRGVVTQGVEVTDQVRTRSRNEARSQELQRRLDIARDNLVSLHDALLPEGLPIAPGVHLAARYLLAEDGARAGGDWFDAVALPDGRVVLVVGDVVGTGVRATVVMGELRTLFEERVRVDGDLVAALQMLEARATRIPQARAATLCVALLDPDAGTLTYCTAGHPPPLVVSPAGDTTYLPLSGSGALGSGLPFVLAQHRLDLDDIVLLYSDGLVERPGRSPVQNTLDLARVAAETVLAADRPDDPVVHRLARTTVEQLTRTSGYDDDITVLAARRVVPPAPLSMTVPAFPDTLRAVRQNLGDWLTGLGVGQIDELALQHAVGELVSNSIEHAYDAERPRLEATVTVTACLLPGGIIEIEVADRGTWRRPGPAGGRGRGLAMASGFSDDLRVSHDDLGTRAVLRQRPSTPVDLLKGSSSAAPVTPAPMEMQQDGLVVEISGTLDHRSSDELRRRLSHATRGGTIGVVVDLAGVTHLGSAGVQVLYDEMIPRRGDTEAGLSLVAPPGSPAQHVLELVRLPYSVEHPPH